MKKPLLFAFLLSISFGSIEAQSDTLDLEVITVTAIKAASDDPLTFQNITAAEIEKIYVGQDPSAVLERLSPSILSYGDGGTNIGNYVQIRMRGISQSRINMTLNGVPLDDMADQATYFSNFSDFGNSLGGIQIHRGVGTSNNGIASFAGSVNFESPNLFSAKKGGELQLLTGSFNTYRMAAEVRTGMNEKGLSFYGRLSRTESDGFKYNSGSDAHSLFISGGYFGEKDIVKFTAFAGKTQNGQAYLPVLRSDIDADPRTNYNHPNDIDDFEQEMVQLKYSRIGIQNLVWNTTAYYSGARGVFPFGLDNTTQLMFGIKNDHYGIFTDLNYDKGPLNIKGGVHAYTFNRRNFDYTAPNIQELDYADHTDKDELSAFAKINFQTNQFNLFADIQVRTVGMKFTAAFQDENWTFFNPKLGVNYQMDESSALYFSFGRTGREPTRADIYNTGGTIKAEYVNDIEFGYRVKTPKLQLNANIFLMDFENEISLVGALQDLSYVDIRQNVSNSTRTGLEVQGAYTFNVVVAIGLNAAYMDSKVDEYESLLNVSQTLSPELIIAPSIKLQVARAIGLTIDGLYASESFIELSNDPNFVTPSFFVLNAQLDINISNAWSLTANLNNIFDEVYFTDGAVVDSDFDDIIDGPGYRIQPPRHAYMMLRWRF